MTKPTAETVKAMAETAGLSVSNEAAERMAHSIGPAFDGFSAIAGTLPMDLEPATFLVVQAKAAS